jgi:hypothetical protein
MCEDSCVLVKQATIRAPLHHLALNRSEFGNKTVCDSLSVVCDPRLEVLGLLRATLMWEESVFLRQMHLHTIRKTKDTIGHVTTRRRLNQEHGLLANLARVHLGVDRKEKNTHTEG